jgi:hypothetical protein
MRGNQEDSNIRAVIQQDADITCVIQEDAASGVSPEQIQT